MSARRGAARGLPWLAALPGLSLTVLASGCDWSTSGGGAPCVDVIGFQLSTPGETWPEGQYELTMTLDGRKVICTLGIDEGLPAEGQLEFSCDSASSWVAGAAYLSNHPDCIASASCEPDAFYTLRGAIYGSPDRIRMELRRDGQTLLDQQVSPTYSEQEISGGQICRSTPPLTFGAHGG